MLGPGFSAIAAPLPCCPDHALKQALAWQPRPAAGRVLWLTGLSGVGKTSLAARLYTQLQDQQAPVAWLDGDALRRYFGLEGRQLDAAGRLQLALRYAGLAAGLARSGAWVVVSTISLFHRVHAKNRLLANENGCSYFEVWLQASEPVRQQRAGDQRGGPRVGGEVPAEFPLAPDLILNNESPASLDQMASQLVRSWR